MKANLAYKGQQLAKKVLIFQTSIALFVTLLVAIFFDKNAAISALVGGIICVVPGLVFARIVFKYAGASQNQRVARSFSQGSKLKLILTIIFFVAAYKWPDIQPIPLMVSYAVTLVAQWPYLLFLNHVESNVVNKNF